MADAEVTRYIDPSLQWSGLFLPAWLLRQGGIPLPAKVVYAALVSWPSSHGTVRVDLPSLAEQLGTPEKFIKRQIALLVDHGLLEVSVNRTIMFLKHDWMRSAADPSQVMVDPKDIQAALGGATVALDVKAKSDVPQAERKSRWQANIEKWIRGHKNDRDAERLIRGYNSGLYTAKQEYERISMHLKGRREVKPR